MIHRSPSPFTRNPDLEIGLAQIVAAQQCKAQYRTIYNQLILTQQAYPFVSSLHPPKSRVPPPQIATAGRLPLPGPSPLLVAAQAFATP
jgi:hypothetical protein